MQIVIANSKKEKKSFKQFRIDLYKNDPFYVSTVEFTLDMLLYQQTELPPTATIRPLTVYSILTTPHTVSILNVFCSVLKTHQTLIFLFRFAFIRITASLQAEFVPF